MYIKNIYMMMYLYATHDPQDLWIRKVQLSSLENMTGSDGQVKK